MTLPYKYKCYIFSRGPPYMYITPSYNLCSICVRSTEKVKLIPLLHTHIYSCVLWKVHPPRSWCAVVRSLGFTYKLPTLIWVNWSIDKVGLPFISLTNPNGVDLKDIGNLMTCMGGYETNPLIYKNYINIKNACLLRIGLKNGLTYLH